MKLYLIVGVHGLELDHPMEDSDMLVWASSADEAVNLWSHDWRSLDIEPEEALKYLGYVFEVPLTAPAMPTVLEWRKTVPEVIDTTRIGAIRVADRALGLPSE